MISTGVPFNTITKFMTSDIISMVNKKSQRSMFVPESNYMSLPKAIKYYLDGVDITTFMDREYANSVIMGLSRLDGRVPVSLAKFKEFIKDASIEDLRAWIKIISENSDKFNLGKTKSLKSGEDAAIDAEMMQDIIDQESFGRNKDFRDLSFLLNRFLSEAIRRKQQLAKLSSDAEQTRITLETLATLNEAGEEISMGSRLCGINQGIKTLRHEFYNYIHAINKFFTDRMGMRFDIIQWVKDENYRNAMNKVYEGKKTTFNILANLSSSPHFSKMFEALALNDDLLQTFSFKYRKFNELANILIGRNIFSSIDPKTARTIKRFIDDVVTSDFLSKSGITFNFNGKQFPYYNQDGSTSLDSGRELTLDSMLGRASFKRIMERHIIPELRSLYPENQFVKDLMFDYFRTPFGVRDFMKLPIDLNNVAGELNELLYTQYTKDFNSLKNQTYMGNRIGDLFFIYNLLVNNNGMGSGTLTKLFEQSVLENDPLINSFMEYEANLQTTDIPYSRKDFLLRFAQEDGSGFDVTYEGGKRKIQENGKEIELFTENNPACLFFNDNAVDLYKVKVDNVYQKLLDLFDENKASIKLTCDE